MNQQRALLIGSFFGASAILFGAFGAHSLKNILIAHKAQQLWNTAVLYHLTHAIALLWVVKESKTISFICWILGMFLFSGSLYLLALTGITWVGAITPVGGFFLVVGWVFINFKKKEDK